MNPDLLKRIGEALYGPRWGAADFEADLGVAERTIRRWLSGQAPIPPSILPEILALCEDANSELADIIDKIKEASTARLPLD